MNDPKSSLSTLVSILQSTWNDGLNNPIYFCLIAIFLEDNLPEAVIASILSSTTGKDSNQILIDIHEIKAHPTNNPNSLLEIREQLNCSGYLYLDLLL